MIELERTFLAKHLPENLISAKKKEILDIYIPASAIHPNLRIRKNGDTYEMTKKKPINKDDPSQLRESTIRLNEHEFNDLSLIPGKKVRKIRHFYPHNNHTAQFDIFCDELNGLVLIDFEFDSINEKDRFNMPDFCLVDITKEDFIAGGMLSGKSYQDIEKNLQKFNYKPIKF